MLIKEVYAVDPKRAQTVELIRDNQNAFLHANPKIAITSRQCLPQNMVMLLLFFLSFSFYLFRLHSVSAGKTTDGSKLRSVLVMIGYEE